MMSCQAVKRYAIPVNDDGTLAESVDVELDRRIRRFMLDHNEADYRKAFDLVCAAPENAALVRAYARS